MLNQNSISDGTANAPATIRYIVDLILNSNVGIVQPPCPELNCLGLDQGDVNGAKRDVVVENTRIRRELSQNISNKVMNDLV